VPPSDVLAAMITPAVLISAAGLLSLSTSNRLARVVDRARVLVKEFESLATQPPSPSRTAHEGLIIRQLQGLTSRARLVQAALTTLYLSLALFILTSLLLGLSAAFGIQSRITLVVSLAGGLCLLASSLLLIAETRIAVRSLADEISFIRVISRDGRTSV
jgi:hypothetical protein